MSALEAAQAALAAEHAAVYGYGVLGGRVTEPRGAEAREGYAAHRARRDALTRTVRDLGAAPVASAPAYKLPFPVPDAAARCDWRRSWRTGWPGSTPISSGRPRGRCAGRPRRAAGGGGAGGEVAGRQRSLSGARRTSGPDR